MIEKLKLLFIYNLILKIRKEPPIHWSQMRNSFAQLKGIEVNQKVRQYKDQ